MYADRRYRLYLQEWPKAFFQHDIAYVKYNDLTKRTQLNKVLRDKAFKITSNPEYDGYQRGLVSMVYKFFDKKSAGSGVASLANKSAIKFMPNHQLANKLHKPIIRKFEKRKVYSSFKYNTCWFGWYAINKQMQQRN